MKLRHCSSPFLLLAAALLSLVPGARAADAVQWVEGFAEVEFHHDANRGASSRDFRGMAPGFMTAGWWAPGQMKDNRVAWKTAVVPEAQPTKFAFIAATAVLPAEFARGPEAKLSINGRVALTFTLGVTRDMTWREGGFELKYISKRVEYPYFGAHRQLDLSGNSGVYQFSVPASAVEAGKAAILQVEVQPFPGWNAGWFMVKQRTNTLQHTLEIVEQEAEALRQDTAVMNEHTQILATQVYKQMLGRDAFEHAVIYQNGFRHVHPADLIRLKNGELLLTTREATEHYAPDGDVVMLRSRDGGRTWGERQVIAHDDQRDLREGCGIQLRDGTVVMGVFFNGNYNTDGSYHFKDSKGTMRDIGGRRRLGTLILTSRDNGHTWSEPKEVDTTGMPFTGSEGPTDAPIEMPDGSIVMGVIGYALHGDAKNTGSVLLRSVDQGQSWTYVSTIASDPGGKLGGFVEPGLVRTKTGRLIAGLRNAAADYAIFVTYSDDDGKTWVPVRKTPMRGHPVDLIQLADGRVMATYGVRPPIHAKPGGIRACFSRDNGESWDLPDEVQIRDDFINWDVGYPESLQFEDGKILTVYYYNLFGKYFIGGTFWRPSARPTP
jgi:sialidase-1